MIEGVTLTPLKQIADERGKVMDISPTSSTSDSGIKKNAR